MLILVGEDSDTFLLGSLFACAPSLGFKNVEEGLLRLLVVQLGCALVQVKTSRVETNFL